ncbi:uncharacterized protein ARMOST_04338 [Armillaria ostoyae]|uniref:AA9 family lytic polysaccharide monooxygenase n=1 Tax=Armillaria ostoyae TaxID=47428 RepID=A0A284QX76_ARMOS|nr:uncharacterized protein ARMOST_04338 [Armillaria ostoyae]
MPHHNDPSPDFHLQLYDYHFRTKTTSVFPRWVHFALASVVSVSAHSIFQELYVDGVSAGHLEGIRVHDYDRLALLLWSDGPEYISTQFLRDIFCNGVINPYHTPISTTIITVPAGSTVTAEWHHTLDGANSADSSDPIDSSHKGAVMSYLAKVDNATQTGVAGLAWFKIYEGGYNASSSTWLLTR